MPKTNAEIAAFRDTNKTRAGWWVAFRQCPKCSKDVFSCPCPVDVVRRLLPMAWDYTGPDFAKDDIACFKELEPPLLAMGFSIYKEKHAGTIIEYPTTSDPSFSGTYAAAVTAAFSWAMDNQPEALRRACEEVGRV